MNNKLEETNLLIDTMNRVINNPGKFTEDVIRETTRTAALLDIAKSLATIADNTSIIAENFKEGNIKHD